MVLLFLAGEAWTQKQNPDVAVWVQKGQFSFEPQTVIPMTGGARQLSPAEFDLRVHSDSLISYLPYFGRAYSISPGEEGGLRFTSTVFEYKAKKEKKGWQVTIVPRDARDVRQLSLHISETGFATLQVNSTNRQPISFSGYVVAVK